MQILIVGGGGREHALAWKFAQSPLTQRIFVAPGNAGTAMEPKVENIAIAATDISALLHFAQQQAMDFTLIGPEAPLALGIVDVFLAAGLKCFGPSQAAAQLESSKAFCKDFLARHAIPTAAYQVFSELAHALAYLQQVTMPIVIKADGLAAGKGVIIAADIATAEIVVREMLAGDRFGSAGRCVVIEEFLSGEEVSFIAIVDGSNILPLATSQDHKALGDGDTGPNTGGMGAYSPAPVLNPALQARVMHEILYPTVRGMAAEGHLYRGFLYAGLMVGADGMPRVLEFNCRLGDPETQPLLLRLLSDLLPLCIMALESGGLRGIQAAWDPRPTLGVVLAAGGYPETYAQGDVIQGLPENLHDAKVFHAATVLDATGQVRTAGGRVLCVTAVDDTLAMAQRRAYALADAIHWPDKYCRRDIGYRALARTPD